MNKEVPKVNNFSGHRLYIGLDVHFKSWSVSIYSEEFELSTFTQPPVPEKLISYLNKNYPGATYVIGYEAGFCGFWIQRAFASQGVDCQVVHAADIGSNDKERRRKSDPIDSRKIAKGLRRHELNSIFVPDVVQEADRQLVRARARQVRDMTRIKNRIKAFLKLHRLSADYPQSNNMHWGANHIKWLQDLDFPQPGDKRYLQMLLEQLLFLKQHIKQAERYIAELAQQGNYQNYTLLTTIPGIGLLSAMIFLTEIGDVNRFKDLNCLCSYCGLVPDTSSSGQFERIGRITRRGNNAVKKQIIECAWVAVRRDPSLLLYYKKAKANADHNRAIIKVARKLLSRIRYILRNQVPYCTNIV
jgi:transposase